MKTHTLFPSTIAAIGASSVFGKVDSQGGFIGRLKNWHESRNLETNRVYNLGIPGDTTSGMLKRLSVELSMRQPNLILFSLGSNDASRHGKPTGALTTKIDQFANNVRLLIKEAQNITSEIIFISAYPINDSKTQPFKGTNKYYSMQDLITYVNMTKQICMEMKIQYFDVFELLIKEGYHQYLYADGLHCNTVGHERIFQELKSLLEKKYEYI